MIKKIILLLFIFLWSGQSFWNFNLTDENQVDIPDTSVSIPWTNFYVNYVVYPYGSSYNTTYYIDYYNYNWTLKKHTTTAAWSNRDSNRYMNMFFIKTNNKTIWLYRSVANWDRSSFVADLITDNWITNIFNYVSDGIHRNITNYPYMAVYDNNVYMTDDTSKDDYFYIDLLNLTGAYSSSWLQDKINNFWLTFFQFWTLNWWQQTDDIPYILSFQDKLWQNKPLIYLYSKGGFAIYKNWIIDSNNIIYRKYNWWNSLLSYGPSINLISSSWLYLNWIYSDYISWTLISDFSKLPISNNIYKNYGIINYLGNLYKFPFIDIITNTQLTGYWSVYWDNNSYKLYYLYWPWSWNKRLNSTTGWSIYKVYTLTDNWDLVNNEVWASDLGWGWGSNSSWTWTYTPIDNILSQDIQQQWYTLYNWSLWITKTNNTAEIKGQDVINVIDWSNIYYNIIYSWFQNQAYWKTAGKIWPDDKFFITKNNKIYWYDLDTNEIQLLSWINISINQDATDSWNYIFNLKINNDNYLTNWQIIEMTGGSDIWYTVLVNTPKYKLEYNWNGRYTFTSKDYDYIRTGDYQYICKNSTTEYYSNSDCNINKWQAIWTIEVKDIGQYDYNIYINWILAFMFSKFTSQDWKNAKIIGWSSNQYFDCAGLNIVECVGKVSVDFGKLVWQSITKPIENINKLWESLSKINYSVCESNNNVIFSGWKSSWLVNQILGGHNLPLFNYIMDFITILLFFVLFYLIWLS